MSPRVSSVAYRTVFLALIAAAFLVRPQAPRNPTLEEIEQLKGSIDLAEITKEGSQQFVMHGEAGALAWDVYVRDTPIGRCLIVIAGNGRSQSCAFREKPGDKPVVAFRIALPNRAHLVVGIGPRRSTIARLAFEGGPTINAQIVLVPGIDAGFFIARVPSTAGAAAVEAFDALGNSLGRWPLPEEPTGTVA